MPCVSCEMSAPLTMHWQVAPEAAPLLDGLPDVDWSAPAAGQPVTEIKHGAGRTVWRIATPRAGVIAKIYAAPRGLHAVKTLMRGRPGLREYQAACFGLEHDLPVTRPVAWGRSASAGGPCVYLSIEIPNARTLRDAWSGASKTTRHVLLRATAELLARLHDAEFRPIDVHPDNILIDDAHRAVLVDLHGAAWGRRVGALRRQWNLAELNQWFQRHASRGERLLCLKTYLAATAVHAKVRDWLTSIAAITAHRGARLAAKRDGRIFGDNKYIGRLRLNDGWQGYVFLAAKDPRAMWPVQSQRMVGRAGPLPHGTRRGRRDPPRRRRPHADGHRRLRRPGTRPVAPGLARCIHPFEPT